VTVHTKRGAEAAFAQPGVLHPNGEFLYGASGLTKREIFAMAAMQGLCANTQAYEALTHAGVTDYARNLADCLIAALSDEGDRTMSADVIDLRTPIHQPRSWRAIERLRQTISSRRKALLLEIAQREAEIVNLDWEWDKTCDEADKLLETR
jgi:hypothetical protein